MKTTIAKILYRFFIWLDRVTGNYNSYRGETAPYCGHGYNGHAGYFTRSHFHESDGGGETKGWFSRYILGVWYSNVDSNEYGFRVPLFIWLRWFYYQAKRWFKHFDIKIDYPYGKRTLYIRLIHFQPRRGYSKNVYSLHVIRLHGIMPVSHNVILI